MPHPRLARFFWSVGVGQDFDAWPIKLFFSKLKRHIAATTRSDERDLQPAILLVKVDGANLGTPVTDFSNGVPLTDLRFLYPSC